MKFYILLGKTYAVTSQDTIRLFEHAYFSSFNLKSKLNIQGGAASGKQTRTINTSLIVLKRCKLLVGIIWRSVVSVFLVVYVNSIFATGYWPLLPYKRPKLLSVGKTRETAKFQSPENNAKQRLHT